MINSGKRGSAMVVVLVVIVVLVAIVVIGVSMVIGISNSIVRKNQAADAAWAQVQNVYQRRLDLIPNLVQTVKGAAAHELDVQVGVIQARAKATQITVDASNPEQFKEFAKNQTELGQSIGRLLVSVEKYPQIKANENFLSLQSQLEGTENRISVERQKFNDAVLDYNNSILTFPGSMIAGSKFHERPYFTSEPGAEKPPKVDFSKPTTSTSCAPRILGWVEA
jgi:LemA protein